MSDLKWWLESFDQSGTLHLSEIDLQIVVDTGTGWGWGWSPTFDRGIQNLTENTFQHSNVREMEATQCVGERGHRGSQQLCRVYSVTMWAVNHSLGNNLVLRNFQWCLVDLAVGQTSCDSPSVPDAAAHPEVDQDLVSYRRN